jgi:hypothetical protein
MAFLVSPRRARLYSFLKACSHGSCGLLSGHHRRNESGNAVASERGPRFHPDVGDLHWRCPAVYAARRPRCRGWSKTRYRVSAGRESGESIYSNYTLLRPPGQARFAGAARGAPTLRDATPMLFASSERPLHSRVNTRSRRLAAGRRHTLSTSYSHKARTLRL